MRAPQPLLEILFGANFAHQKAGNRRLFMDQYSALILMSLFSPAIESLRDLQRACALDKVRKRLGVSRASLGSLSESVAIFDPAPLKEIAVELGHMIRSKPHESHRGIQGPSSDGVLRIVTDRLDLSAELIAEMVRLR